MGEPTHAYTIHGTVKVVGQARLYRCWTTKVEPNQLATDKLAFWHQGPLKARLLEPRGQQLPMPNQLAAAAWLLYMQQQ